MFVVAGRRRVRIGYICFLAQAHLTTPSEVAYMGNMSDQG